VNFAARTIANLKQFTMNFVGASMRGWSVLLGRTRFDYAHDARPELNSIVMAAVGWIARTFPEAPVQVLEQNEESEWETVDPHPFTKRIERPNEFYSGVLLWMATLVEYNLFGNSVWLKVRSGAGRVVELWWVPWSTIKPRWPDDGSAYITHYEYTPNSFVRMDIPPSEVVHFRYGLSADMRTGMSPLASVLREVFTDDEAANFSAALLRNLGIPGVILAPDDDITAVNPDDALALKEKYVQTFGGDKRGEPMVVTSRIKPTVLSFSPEQMNLKDLRRVPEERITAVLGVAAIVAGMGAGLDRSTFANYGEAREAAYEENIIPTQRLLAAELQTQLLPDFADEERQRVDLDRSQVRILQEDQDSLYTRVDTAVKGGWATVADARRAVGLPVDETHDIYLRPVNVIEVPADETQEERLSIETIRDTTRDEIDAEGVLERVTGNGRTAETV
jgi:HK97 family phage portal protein